MKARLPVIYTILIVFSMQGLFVSAHERYTVEQENTRQTSIKMNRELDQVVQSGSWFSQISGTSKRINSVHFANINFGWAVGDEGIILFSSDGGDTWSSQSSGVAENLRGVYFTDVKTGWVVGWSGTILHTNDGGATWISQNMNTSENLFAVSFMDSLHGWVVGENNIIRYTNNGGSNWYSQTPPTGYNFFSAYALDSWDQDRVWIAPWGGDPGGGILATTNGGAIWNQQQTNGLYYMTGVDFISATEGWAVGYELGEPSCPGDNHFVTRVFHTSNGGDIWVEVGNICGYSSKIDFVNASQGWLIIGEEWESSRIYASSDGGANWSEQYSESVLLDGIQMLDARNGWAVGSNGTILRFLADEINFYFPLVQKSPPQIEIVVTDIYNSAFIANNHIYGYISSLIPDPYYSVTLEAEGIYYPFCDDDEPCDPVKVKIPITPALPATLPNQINPFSDENLCYKACVDYHSPVRVISGSRTEPSGDIYYPLTVVKWKYTAEDEYKGILSGTIRNDNQQTLHKLRLVVAELEKCAWREAEIADTKINPNRQTTFQLPFYEGCLGDNLVIVGQGAAQK